MKVGAIVVFLLVFGDQMEFNKYLTHEEATSMHMCRRAFLQWMLKTVLKLMFLVQLLNNLCIKFVKTWTKSYHIK